MPAMQTAKENTTPAVAPEVARGGGDPLKPWRTVQARFALAGLTAELVDGDDGQPMLVVSRWALTKCLRSVAEADAWLERFQGGAG